MEEHRRTDAGRVRTAKEFVSQFFKHDDGQAKDALFLHMPNEVRGPVIASWGIRGAKAALRDDDERIRTVVHDGLVAGDIDDAIFEDGVNAQILIDWVPLTEWWSFWRQGKLTGVAIQKALATARELSLIDDKWFLLNVQGRGGKLKGTDVVCDTLSKDQIVAWLRKLHESSDATPAGIISAIGWETVLSKTAQDALLFALDAFARKAGLAPELVDDKPAARAGSATAGAPQVGAAAPLQSAGGAAILSSGQEPLTTRHERPAEVHTTISAPAARELVEREKEVVTAMATATAPPAAAYPAEVERGLPDLSARDSSPPEDDGESTKPASITGVQDRAAWAAAVTAAAEESTAEESPRLAEARAAMMKTLLGAGTPPAGGGDMWEDSEPPAKPSSLEWPEPPNDSVPVEGRTPEPAEAAHVAEPEVPVADARGSTKMRAAPPLPSSTKMLAAVFVAPMPTVSNDDLIPIDTIEEDDVHSEHGDAGHPSADAGAAAAASKPPANPRARR